MVEGQSKDQAAMHGIDEDAVLETVMPTKYAIKRLIVPHEVATLAAFLALGPVATVTGSPTC